MSSDEERHQIEQVIDRLAARHAGLPHRSVEQIVHEVYATFEAGRVRDFVPLLVERSAQRTIATLIAS